MTTLTTSLPPARGRAGLKGVFGSEWTKILSVRSTMLSIVVMAGIATGLNALINYFAIVRDWEKTPPDVQAAIQENALEYIFSGPMSVAQFGVAVIGVMAITSEYATGMIRSTLQSQPRRGVILAAKVLVLTALILVVGEALTFGGFLVGKSIIADQVSISFSDEGVLRVVAGAGVYLTVLALFSLALGTLIRHTAGGLASVLGLILLISNLTGLLPDTWGKYVDAYMPTNAGSQIMQRYALPNAVLSPWQGLGVFAAETAVLLLAAWYLLRHRDV
jgi:ABC-2 type transport system permease protein